MSSTASWLPTRNDITHSLDQANKLHEQAEGARVDNGDVKSLEVWAQKEMASSPTTSVEQATRSLPTRENNAVLVARCRQHFMFFEDLVFLHFHAELPNLAAPAVAEWVKTFDGALATLDTLEMCKGHEDDTDNIKAYVADYGWMKGAWEKIVKELGLSTEDYAALREFNKNIHNYVHLSNDEEPEQTLQVLQSSTFRKDLQKYKQPLANLLECLARLRSTDLR